MIDLESSRALLAVVESFIQSGDDAGQTSDRAARDSTAVTEEVDALLGDLSSYLQGSEIGMLTAIRDKTCLAGLAAIDRMLINYEPG